MGVRCNWQKQSARIPQPHRTNGKRKDWQSIASKIPRTGGQEDWQGQDCQRQFTDKGERYSVQGGHDNR